MMTADTSGTDVQSIQTAAVSTLHGLVGIDNMCGVKIDESTPGI